MSKEKQNKAEWCEILSDSESKRKMNCCKTVLIKFLKSIQNPQNPVDVCIVGSMALCQLGLDNVVPHDIDIEMVCDDAMEAKLKLLAESQGNHFHSSNVDSYPFGAEKRMKNVTWKHKPYVFKWDNVLINVWAVSAISHRYIQDSEGIKWAVISSVLNKKCAYRRRKDYEFINKTMEWLMSFLKDVEEPTN